MRATGFGVPPAPEAQAVLPFVSDAERQISTDAYERIVRRSERRVHRPPAEKPQVLINIELLAMPLFEAAMAEVLRVDPLDPGVIEIDVPPTDEDQQDKQEAIEWIADRSERFVGWYLERVFEKSDSPARQHRDPDGGSGEIFQVPVPGKSHEDIRQHQ